jgi:RNA polymerase sigma factor (sigma-70 family)
MKSFRGGGWVRNEMNQPPGSVPGAHGAVMDSHTSATLLTRLRQIPPDEAAWGRFVERYGRKIFGWCRQWNLQEADAEDVTQGVLLKLAEKMRAFEYDPTRSFRAWLKTVTRHAWLDSCSGRPVVAGGSTALELLQTAEAREDLVQRLDAEFDHELLEEATARVRERVAPRTWEAFERTALRGESGAEAATALGMKVATVFVARSKVQKMLQEELQKLNSEGEPRA